ncbi:DUF4870 domain-containing protein [Thiohalorhabdus sp.]|uniref:DUF4870 domain-containing protein n=1 Tax=Thiohalorhabdus sp. TaxID=3094134 RepID=UPI002FC35DFB
MITVASFENQADAHIAKGRLEAEGLSPVLGDSHLVQTDWLYSAALGGIKLQVPEMEAERARQLIDQDHSAELEGLDQGHWDAEDADTDFQRPGAVDAPDRWAALIHMAALGGAVIPFGHLLGPLVAWLWRRGTSPEADAAGREAINFQITVTLYAGILAVILPQGADVPVLVTLFSLDLALVLVAASRTRRGLAFRYPLTLRVLF